MNRHDFQDDVASETEDAQSHRKLDLAYFTEADRCPLMVRRGARGAFELFLFLAHRFLDEGGKPIMAEREALCGACGLAGDTMYSRSAISRHLRALRETYRVIDYSPVQRRQPQISLAPAKLGSDILNPRHYIYLAEAWNAHTRKVFHVLGSDAFSAEYMYWIAQYEAALAATKHGRGYWFYPLAQLSRTYHVSTQFAASGLKGLIKLGIMHVAYGQFGIQAKNDEFGAANRYYFQGLAETTRRRYSLDLIANQYENEFEIAFPLALELTNGQTPKNVAGLCELVGTYGEGPVREVLGKIGALPRRSLKRRLAYVRTILLGGKDGS